MSNIEFKEKKPKKKRIVKGLAAASIILSTVTVSTLYYLSTGPVFNYDSSESALKQKLYSNLNNLSFALEDKLDFKTYKWNREGIKKENMTNLGVLAENGKWTIYREGGTIYRVKTGDSIEKGKPLVSDFSYHINSTERGIFYERVNDGKLYYIDFNGENKKAIVDDEVSYVTAIGDWIYYTNFSDKTNLYKVKYDGSGKQKVIDGGVMNFIIDGDYVYYSDFNDESKLYRAKLDGSEKVALNNHPSWRIFVGENYIYYQNSPSYEGELYRIPKKGGEPEKLIDTLVDGFVVLNDKTIYYSTHAGAENEGFYKYSIGDKKSKKINDNLYIEFSFYKNQLIMKEYGGNIKAYFDIETEQIIKEKKL